VVASCQLEVASVAVIAHAAAAAAAANAAAAAAAGKRVDLTEVLKLRMNLAEVNYAWFVQSSYQVSCGGVMQFCSIRTVRHPPQIVCARFEGLCMCMV
jgi:hypothetical protein